MHYQELHNCRAQRSGAAITIAHSHGKVASIDLIQREEVKRDGAVARWGFVATAMDGRKFELVS